MEKILDVINDHLSIISILYPVCHMEKFQYTFPTREYRERLVHERLAA